MRIDGPSPTLEHAWPRLLGRSTKDGHLHRVKHLPAHHPAHLVCEGAYLSLVELETKWARWLELLVFSTKGKLLGWSLLRCSGDFCELHSAGWSNPPSGGFWPDLRLRRRARCAPVPLPEDDRQRCVSGLRNWMRRPAGAV
jgi:hypothetical protein